MGLVDRILRAGEGKRRRLVADIVPDINVLEPEIKALSDDALRAKTGEFRQRLDNGATLDDILVEAFAVVREASMRVIGQRHYDVQLMGGVALHLGWVAEMKTGEGKTLVSTLPVYLNALGGRGVHLVTVNDYLATFHADWMGQIYRWLGLTVGLVVPGQLDTAYKREQYACDITYGTNNEFGFDYQRDNMASTLDRKVQRGHAYGIVDEVDSILIDEARTPLIISGRVADAAKLYYQFASIARMLQRDSDYEVDEEKRIVSPTEDGIDKVERSVGIDNLYDGVSQNLVHQLQAALKAKELYRRDRDYIVQNGEVKIVDEFTGRILEGRRWSEGIHQAVEAKEGVKIKEENQTLATITLQNYFRLYEKLAGMTGTATTEAGEFANTYGLQVAPIATHKPMVRADQHDVIFRTEDAKWEAVVDDLVERYGAGQPVLVGTVSVEKSELLSRLLNKRGIPHEVLNAKQHFREAEIIAQAGRLGSVTVATNMAGRGVDIILGGNAEKLAQHDVKAEVLELESEDGEARFKTLFEKYKAECGAEGDEVRGVGGLYVLGTERHESRRIDNQLRGRSGRQGDPGESRFYLSLEDELMRLFATGAMNWVMSKGMDDDVPIESKMVSKAIERAQNTVEQRNAEIRKNVLKYDEVMNEQRKVIYKRRDQILEGADLRTEALEYLADAIESTITTFCVSDYSEEWDVDGLLTEIHTFWPSKLSPDEMRACASTDELYEKVAAEAVAYYEQRESDIGPELMREVERQIMLRIIDQKWREHLHEMDYLKEGINLRAMGQRDPLVEWQRDGYQMFEQMMHGISQDFVKYVMHAQVNVAQREAGAGAGGAGDADESAVRNVQYSAAEDPVQGAGSVRAAARPAAEATASGSISPPTEASDAPSEEEKNVPIVKSEWEKTPRNAPCPCGSGKKFKLCHGR
ncbi:MAG: preprotein translocase subunit SecA [Acidimicrobiales bacterium]